MAKYLETRIWMTADKKKYCRVRLYLKVREMQKDFKAFRPDAKQHYKTLGVHCAYDLFRVDKSGRKRFSKETGTIFLCKDHCGAGIATHEIMHGIFWAFRHKSGKQQYPFTIQSMEQEEELLQNFTFAVRQFYDWYWKVESKH